MTAAGHGGSSVRATITILPGDGIGREVIPQAVRMLETVQRRWGHEFEMREAAIGGAAMDATGNPLPAETVALCKSADAVLLGAVGGPKWDDPSASVRPEQGLLGLRKALDVYANLRPVAASPHVSHASPLRKELLDGVDILFVRELTGGLYFGQKTRGAISGGREGAMDVCEYSTSEIERVVRVAAALAQARRGRLTSVDKANVLETSRLWRSVAQRIVQDEFPDIRLDHMLVDTCAMRLIQSPAHFDVIVTENMFGDILTDEASVLAGSMGLLASASLGDCVNGRRRGLYEPIHGSAPDIAGRNVANPIGAILSAALLLRHSLGLEQEAAAVERAVETVLGRGLSTPDIAAPGRRRCSTKEMGEAVAEAL